MLCDESAEIVFTVNNGLPKDFLNSRKREKFIKILERTGFDHASLVTSILIAFAADDDQRDDDLHTLFHIPV